MANELELLRAAVESEKAQIIRLLNETTAIDEEIKQRASVLEERAFTRHDLELIKELSTEMKERTNVSITAGAQLEKATKAWETAQAAVEARSPTNNGQSAALIQAATELVATVRKIRMELEQQKTILLGFVERLDKLFERSRKRKRSK